MSLTIGIDTSSANKKQKTGVEWYAYHLIRALSVIDQKNKYKLYTSQPLEAGLLNLGSNFREVVLKWPGRYLWLQGRLSVEMAVNPPDVLLVPAQPLPMITPKKSINAIHDLGFVDYPEAYSKKMRKYLKWQVKHAIKYAKKIITISRFTKNELMRLYSVPEEQISVIYLGYDPEIYKPIHDETRLKHVKEKFGLSDKFILYIGRIEQKKNINTLVKAFEKLGSDLQLVLVGKPGFGYENIKKNLGGKNIKELGWVCEEDVPVLLNASKCFVLPSFYEGFGLPIIQAMACGAPVISSDIPTLKEIGGEASLYFQVDSSDDLADKLRLVLNDQNLAENLVQKGFERCKNFSWQKCAQETLDLINRLSDDN